LCLVLFTAGDSETPNRLKSEDWHSDMIVQFKPREQKKPKGMFETGTVFDGMLLVDGCIPVSVLPDILQILDKAGVTLGEMVPEYG
jgi:hypothetical protein